MSSKKKKISIGEKNEIPKWKESPPGAEQKELNRLFMSGIITDMDSPDSIRKQYPIFTKFNTNVFGAHFRKTKAKYGLNRKY